MAEFVFKDMVKKLHCEDQFIIASAATSTEEIGNPVSPGTRNKLRECGISCAGKTAVQLRREDYDKYDYLIGMDTYNIRNIEKMTGHKGDKIHLLLEFTGLVESISDPWYTGDYEQTYRDVVLGCKGLLRHIKKPAY
jgi:protein-tyrosine phosphatase